MCLYGCMWRFTWVHFFLSFFRSHFRSTLTWKISMLCLYIYFDDYRCHVYNVYIFLLFFFGGWVCSIGAPFSTFAPFFAPFVVSSSLMDPPRSSLYRCLSFLWTEQLLLVETLFNNYTNLIHNSYGLEKKLLFIFSVFKIAPVRTLSPFLRILMLLNSISHTIDYKRYGWYEFHHSTIFINTSQFQLRFSFEFSPFFLSLSFSALAFQANRKKNSFLCAHSN